MYIGPDDLHTKQNDYPNLQPNYSAQSDKQALKLGLKINPSMLGRVILLQVGILFLHGVDIIWSNI